MVMARLHVICGNCGAAAAPDTMTFRIVPDGMDFGEKGMADAVSIHCKNCGTLHYLEDTIVQSDMIKRLPDNDK